MKRLLLATLLTTFAIPSAALAQRQGTPGKFDFYVLALSWSPDYCASKGGSDRQQCGEGKKLGFVLHGLWPQYNRGYPANCSTQKLPPEVKKQFPNLFPSDKLYSHEWEKHGTCTGKTPAEYMALSKQYKEAVTIPAAYRKPVKPFRTTVADLKQEFAKANNGMSADSVAPSCSGSGRFLQEVLICFTKDGKLGVCSAEILKRSQKSCGQANLLVRNVR
ncbi:ribonuclease [Calothrix sp. 336/3]|nr:ribonuclease [Calothrix sp. 336/3]